MAKPVCMCVVLGLRPPVMPAAGWQAVCVYKSTSVMPAAGSLFGKGPEYLGDTELCLRQAGLISIIGVKIKKKSAPTR